MSKNEAGRLERKRFEQEVKVLNTESGIVKKSEAVAGKKEVIFEGN